MKNYKLSRFAFITKCTTYAFSVFEKSDDCAFHVHFNVLMNTIILKGSNHFKPGSVNNVRKQRIFMTTKISLQYTAIFCSVKQRSPCLQFKNPVRSFFCMELCHAPVIKILTTAHSISEMHFPVIPFIHIS